MVVISITRESAESIEEHIKHMGLINYLSIDSMKHITCTTQPATHNDPHNLPKHQNLLTIKSIHSFSSPLGILE
jgi:hypothetical protein